MKILPCIVKKQRAKGHWKSHLLIMIGPAKEDFDKICDHRLIVDSLVMKCPFSGSYTNYVMNEEKIPIFRLWKDDKIEIECEDCKKLVEITCY